jgi:hypothetical protein
MLELMIKADTKNSLYEDLEHVHDQLWKYHVKTLSGDLNAKAGREDTSNQESGISV